MAAIEAYGKGGFSQLVFDGKHEFVEHYNFDSPYWKPRSRADNPRVVQELKTNLKDVATYFHASAQKSKRVADYQEAARWYRDYLKSFPEDADSAATDYLLAEALFESHQYADAAAEYEHTAYGYPRNEKSATAAYAALVSYQKGEEGLSGADKDAWHKRAMDAGVRFAQSFPEHPDSAGVLTRAAEEIFAAGDQPRAVSVSESILARQPPVDAAKQRIAWTIIAQARFDQGDYAKAEPAFLQARELAGKDDKMRADLTERLAASVYKEGEAKQKAGDGGGAVEDFLRVGRVAPESKIRANAQEARQRLADYAGKSGDGARRDHWYQEIIRADAQAGGQRTDRTHYLAAKAQLALAQPARDAFRAVRLTAPLKKSLIVKRDALEHAMDGYKRSEERRVGKESRCRL